MNPEIIQLLRGNENNNPLNIYPNKTSLRRQKLFFCMRNQEREIGVQTYIMEKCSQLNLLKKKIKI